MSLRNQISKRVVVGVLALCCTSATAAFAVVSQSLAVTPEYELVGSFGGFEDPQAIAVDDSTTGPMAGDVYVVDMSNPFSVRRFDAAGKPAPFSASVPYIHGNRLEGTPSGTFFFSGYQFGTPVAVGVAVDASTGPTHGDLYVADANHGRVDVFGSDGTFLGEVDVGAATPQSGGEPCGLAVNPSGHLLIGWLGGRVDEFTPVDANPADDVFDRQLESLGAAVCDVAQGSSGETFVNGYPEGPLFSYEASQFGSEAPVFSSELSPRARALGVDPGNGNVFFVEGTGVVEHSANGEPVGSPFGSLASAMGLAVNGSNGRVYVSDEASESVEYFEVPTPGAPSVESEFSLNVEASSAELHAQLRSKLLDTRYHFEYGTSTAYGQSTPIGDAGSGSKRVDAEALLTGLEPSTIYHYRLVASNTGGSTLGPDETFTTQPFGGPLVLPDERAWEMVSPVEKNGGEVAGIGGVAQGGLVQASADGEKITYLTLSAFGESEGNPPGDQYIASREPDGWSTQALATPMKAGGFAIGGKGTPYKAFSSDLSSGLQVNGEAGPVTNPPLTSDAPAGYQNFYLRSTDGGALQALITSTPEQPAAGFHAEFVGSSADLEHVVFESNGALTPGAVAEGTAANLYEWSAGRLYPINVLPGVTTGQTVPHAELGFGADASLRDSSNAVSEDGSRVFFTVGGILYLRKDADSSAATTELVAEGGEFWGASSSGSVVFFTKAREDLYSFDVESGVTTDLTSHRLDASGALVQGVLGVSSDGSYIYFVADGRLADGAEEDGTCNSLAGAGGKSCWLYVWHEGHVGLVGTRQLDQSDLEDWTLPIQNRTARVSGDGRHLVFVSSASPGLTGYDNLDAHTGQPDSEVYEYSAPSPEEEARAPGSAGTLVCASCNPTGERPSGSSSIPGGTAYTNTNAQYQARVVSFDGSRVFFDSRDALVPQDTNGLEDIYEWEAPAQGTCTTAGASYSGADQGCVSLISGGTGNEPSRFVDASESGDDVFFTTVQQFVPQDTDDLTDLYDARVGGGFAATSSLACTGTGCQGVPSAPPIFATPSSGTFNGVGNFTSPAEAKTVTKKAVKCGKGKKLAHGKCVKSRKKAKKTKPAKKPNHRKGRASR